MVGKKNIKTEVLDLLKKTNFEVLKDGTGKPLKAHEGEFVEYPKDSNEDPTFLDKIMDGITKISQAVANVIDNILSIAKKVLDKITTFINKVMSVIKNIIKSVMEAIAKILEIPMKFIKEIIHTVTGYVRKMLGAIGGWLKDKLNLGGIGSLGDGFKKFLNKIFAIAAIGGSIVGGILSLKELKNVIKNLLGKGDRNDVIRGMRFGLNRRRNLPGYYYDEYYKLIGKDNVESLLYGNKRLGHRASRSYNYRGNTLDQVWSSFKDRGLKISDPRDLGSLARNDTIDHFLRKNYQKLHGGIDHNSYTDFAGRGSSLSDLEKLSILRTYHTGQNNIRFGGGSGTHLQEHYYYRKVRDLINFRKFPGGSGTLFSMYRSDGSWKNINRIATTMDLNKYSNVKKYKEGDSLTEFNGFTNKTTLPEHRETVKPSKYGLSYIRI